MNKYIKNQLQKANVVIRYPDGTIVDLDNVTNCEFVIEKFDRNLNNADLQNMAINDALNIFGYAGAVTGRFNSSIPNESAKPQNSYWPEVKIKRKK